MAWDKNYRLLKFGEIIQAGDECDVGDDEPQWKPTICVGMCAPDPLYQSHRRYRRKIRKSNKGTDL